MELDNGMVVLVATDTITPYKKGEVFAVTHEAAEKLLTRDMTPTDFGYKYPNVKVRRYIPEQDEELLLQNKVLNQKEHEKLFTKLHPAAKKQEK